MKILVDIIGIVVAFILFALLYNLILSDIKGCVNRALDEHGFAHTEEKEAHMTTAKMQKINDWMAHLDQQTMDLSDQLAITQATMEYLAKLEPIYDKCTGNKKETRYR